MFAENCGNSELRSKARAENDGDDWWEDGDDEDMDDWDDDEWEEEYQNIDVDDPNGDHDGDDDFEEDYGEDFSEEEDWN